MNKKIIFVILLFIGISFIVYSFANPITDGENNELSQNGIGESEKNDSYSNRNEDDDLDSSDMIDKNDDEDKDDEDDKDKDDENDEDKNEKKNVSSSTSSTTNIVTSKPSTSSNNTGGRPSTSITGNNNINSGGSSNSTNNSGSGNNAGSTNGNGNNSSSSGNSGGTTPPTQPTNPDPVVPTPKPAVQTTISSRNPDITVRTGNGTNELYLSGQLHAELYRDATINDVFEVYKISLHFVPSDSSIVGSNVTYRFSKTMGLHGESKRASLNNDKSFDVDLIINSNLFNSSKSLIVYIDWNDENGETAYTINLNELRTN